MRNITEFAITPETPKVAFEQQLNVHVPIASTFNKGIAQYSAAHFSVANGVVTLNNSILEKFTNIVHVDSLPDLSEADSNLLYHVTTDYDTIYICDNDKTKWIQLDKAIYIANSMNDIVDASKLYCILSGDESGVYILYNNAPLRVLTNIEYLKLTSEIAKLRVTVDAKEIALKEQIQGVQDIANNAVTIANNAVSTANSANAQSQTAVSVSNQAQETANEAVTVANEASTKSTTAVNTSDEAKRIAQEALNKAGNVTGGLVQKGSIESINDLPAPSAETYGWMYNVNDAFTTTDQFVEGAGISYLAGENVAIVNPAPGVYKYDVFSGIVDLTPLENEIDDLKEQVADLLYKAITITSFTNNVNTVEIGSTVTAVNLSWSFSKTPKTVTLDGVAKAVDSTGESLTGLSLTSAKTWTLRATDERDAAATKTTAISFLNGVYYGVAEAPNAYDSAFVLGLTKTLRSSKLTSFNVNAGAGQFIYYCIPTRFGTASFKVGGFDGGFSLVDTISFTNSKGYTENYYIYKSDNANLGSTAVSVS